MARITISHIVGTSIVTAFTIAAGLTWKDVIMDFISKFVPAGEQLIYKFIAAILVTVFVVFAIYFVVRAEREAEVFVREAKKIPKKVMKRRL